MGGDRPVGAADEDRAVRGEVQAVHRRRAQRLEGRRRGRAAEQAFSRPPVDRPARIDRAAGRRSRALLQSPPGCATGSGAALSCAQWPRRRPNGTAPVARQVVSGGAVALGPVVRGRVPGDRARSRRAASAPASRIPPCPSEGKGRGATAPSRASQFMELEATPSTRRALCGSIAKPFAPRAFQPTIATPHDFPPSRLRYSPPTSIGSSRNPGWRGRRRPGPAAIARLPRREKCPRLSPLRREQRHLDPARRLRTLQPHGRRRHTDCGDHERGQQGMASKIESFSIKAGARRPLPSPFS